MVIEGGGPGGQDFTPIIHRDDAVMPPFSSGRLPLPRSMGHNWTIDLDRDSNPFLWHQGSQKIHELPQRPKFDDDSLHIIIQQTWILVVVKMQNIPFTIICQQKMSKNSKGSCPEFDPKYFLQRSEYIINVAFLLHFDEKKSERRKKIKGSCHWFFVVKIFILKKYFENF